MQTFWLELDGALATENFNHSFLQIIPRFYFFSLYSLGFFAAHLLGKYKKKDPDEPSSRS